METRTPTLAGLAAVVGFALSCFGLLVYLWTTFGGPTPLAPESYRFKALYPDATQLIAQTDVRISGVDVGRVTAVTQEGEVAEAEIELDAEHAPIPAETRTLLRRKTLLGEPFIELIPPTEDERSGEMLPEDGQLPTGQVEHAVDLDEVLRALDRPTRRELRLVLGELARGVGDQGEELNSAIGNLAPVAEGGADLFEILNSQKRATQTLVRDSGEVLQALSERRGALSSLVESGASVLDATASRDRELTETVELLPPLLAELRPTLELSRELAVDAGPFLDELGPASKLLPGTLRDLHALAPDLRATFQELGPLLHRAPTGIPALTSTLAAARPLMRESLPALQELIPAIEYLLPYHRELAAWQAKLGLATQSSAVDAGGTTRHILRTIIPMTPEGLGIFNGDPLEILATNRHNPYAKPGYLDEVGNPFVKAFDCRNVASGLELPPPFDSAPPCEEQGPFEINGFTGTYPQVHRTP